MLGGTGRMGLALASQLSKKNDVIIGSRDPSRARRAAGTVPGTSGEDYLGATEKADTAIFSIPYAAIGLASSLAEALSGKLVISVINPIKTRDGIHEYPLPKGSAAEELAGLLPRARVATSFNHVSSLFLEKATRVPMDVLVAADSKQTYESAATIVSSIANMRPLYAGPLNQARTIEMMTPLLVNLSRLNGAGSFTTKFVSTREAP